jgi:hypothetical protein
MKKRAIWMLVPAVALGLGACKKKEEAKAPETTTPPAAEAALKPGESGSAATEAMKAPALSAEERAAKLGFAKHLPQDTEVVMAFHNGSKTVDRIQASKLWQAIQSEMGAGMMGGGFDVEPGAEEMEEDFELPEAEQDADTEETEEEIAEPMGPAKLFGTEFTLALGKSGSAQTGNLLTINRRMGYFQMRGLAKVFVDAVKSGDFTDFETAIDDQFGEQLAKDLLNDSESGAALFDKMGMPPLYLAFRTTPEDRESAAQQLAALAENLGMLGDVVETVEVEKAGAKFAGQKIVGAKVAKLMEESRGDMEGIIDADSMDKLIASAAKKNLVVLSGSLGDYAVLFIGGSEDDMNLTTDLGQSLVAGDSLAFCDSYVSKDLAAVILGRKEMLDTLTISAGGLADFTSGLRDGIAGSDALGDTRDLEALLRMVGERESALRKLASNETGGMAAFFEDGLKIETHGGMDNGALDWKTPNRMTSLGDSEDVVLFANMTTEAAYDEAMRGYLEALMETGYAIAMQVAEVPGEADELAQFREMTKTFDTKFREDIVAFWQAFSGDFDGGLGNESALVVDLKGSMPPIPGVPQAVVDEAKFPRITMIAPVTDRAKLRESWQKMNSSITNILGKVSEMSGQDIPMQKPISSDKNGFTTWFFSMPFFNDDFLPSVTVGDQWFAASSSKVHALDLIDKASKAKAEKTGLFFTVNFKALQTFARETAKTLDKNAEAVSLSKEDLETFSRSIEAMDEIDKLTIHARRENGELRTSVHFKTK